MAKLYRHVEKAGSTSSVVQRVVQILKASGMGQVRTTKIEDEHYMVSFKPETDSAGYRMTPTEVTNALSFLQRQKKDFIFTIGSNKKLSQLLFVEIKPGKIATSIAISKERPIESKDSEDELDF